MEIEDQAEHIAKLMHERLGARGRGLDAKLAHGGRRLPRAVREEAEFIALAARMARVPRLAQQVDPVRVTRAVQDVEAYLRGVDPLARLRAGALDWLRLNLFNLLLVAGMVVALMAWRGLL